MGVSHTSSCGQDTYFLECGAIGFDPTAKLSLHGVGFLHSLGPLGTTFYDDTIFWCSLCLSPTHWNSRKGNFEKLHQVQHSNLELSYCGFCWQGKVFSFFWLIFSRSPRGSWIHPISFFKKGQLRRFSGPFRRHLGRSLSEREAGETVPWRRMCGRMVRGENGAQFWCLFRFGRAA